MSIHNSRLLIIILHNEIKIYKYSAKSKTNLAQIETCHLFKFQNTYLIEKKNKNKLIMLLTIKVQNI